MSRRVSDFQTKLQKHLNLWTPNTGLNNKVADIIIWPDKFHSDRKHRVAGCCDFLLHAIDCIDDVIVSTCHVICD